MQVGDTGKVSEDLRSVAQQMALWRAKTDASFVMLNGDNFYEVRGGGRAGHGSGSFGGITGQCVVVRGLVLCVRCRVGALESPANLSCWDHMCDPRPPPESPPRLIAWMLTHT